MSTQKITDDMTDEQKEHIRAKRREWQRNYRKKNKEKEKEYRQRYYEKHPEKKAEKQRKNAARRRAKRRAMLPLAKMYKGEPKAPKPHPKKYHEFDRDKLAAYKMTKAEKREAEEIKKRLQGLDLNYKEHLIDLETYIRDRSILLNKIKKYDKTYISNDDE
ncbi:MAG: hypothetical protein II523_00775 [Bacteroidales bacterium]|nr:hypothetical protein [Bacteroidales bacterium]